MTKFRALMLGTVATGLALGTVTTDAHADKMVSSGTDKTSFQIKGHVNRGIMIADDGDDTEVFYVDNGTSESRMTLTGKGKVSEDLSVKAVVELRFEQNRSDAVDFSTEDAPTSGTDRGVGIRHTYVSFSSKKFGTLSTGQMSDVADGAHAVDLSGTGLSGAYSDGVLDVGNAIDFKTANNGTSTDSIGGMWFSGDGTRSDLIRYDSPSFGGLAVHGSMTQGGWGIAALTYSGEFSGFKVAGAVGYSSSAATEALGVNSHWVGSASVLHESGISLTGAFTAVDEFDDTVGSTREDPTTFYGKLGYQAKLVDAGKSYFSISYGKSEDASANDDEIEVIQFGFVQKIDAAATELYLSVSHADANAGATNYEEIVWGIAGARVKF